MATESFLVVGGSGDIGAATCERLAVMGYRPIVGYYRSHHAASHVAGRCGGTPLALDLTDGSSIMAALNLLENCDDPLTGVILAASPAPLIAPFGKIFPEEMQRQWQVNVAGPQRLLSGIVNSCFRKRKSGTVVGILTQAMGNAQRQAACSMGPYVIAKFGLAGLLAVVAAEYPWLRVRSVSPGYTETKMLEVFDERFLELMRTKEKFCTPQEVAERIIQEIQKP